MSIEEKITSRRLIQVTVTLIGLFSAIVGIYTFYFQTKETELQFEIISNSNVLDLNTDLSKLDIIYDSTSLKHSNQNLRIINIRVKNTGTEDILKNFYDDSDPLGLIIRDGTIIEKPNLINYSNDYLKNNLKLNRINSNKILFSNVILEHSEYFVLKFLVLHPRGKTPAFTAIGKVAGINKINVIDIQQPKDKKSFWSQVFSGDILVQAVRAILYFSIVVIIIGIIALIVEGVSDFKSKKKRERLIHNFKRLETYSYSKMDDAIFNRFITEGDYSIVKMKSLIRDEATLNRRYKKWIEKLKKKETEEEAILNKEVLIKPLFLNRRREWTVINEMLNDGIIIKDNNTLIINQPMKKTIELFTDYLQTCNFGQFKNYRHIIETDTEG